MVEKRESTIGDSMKQRVCDEWLRNIENQDMFFYLCFCSSFIFVSLKSILNIIYKYIHVTLTRNYDWLSHWSCSKPIIQVAPALSHSRVMIRHFRWGIITSGAEIWLFVMTLVSEVGYAICFVVWRLLEVLKWLWLLNFEEVKNAYNKLKWKQKVKLKLFIVLILSENYHSNCESYISFSTWNLGVVVQPCMNPVASSCGRAIPKYTEVGQKRNIVSWVLLENLWLVSYSE